MSREHLKWVKAYFEQVYKTPVLEKFLALKIAKVAEGTVTYRAKIEAEHCNLYGGIHGGTLASLADVVMGCSCVTLGRRVVTIDMNISYIKNAPQGCTLTAVGEVVSRGKTIMRATGEIYEGKTLLARSQASYFVVGEFSESDCPAPR